jgi:Bacteriophage replication protein O
VTKDFRYEGFAAPNYTPVPDDVFDVIAPELTESELRVLLYILRRTFGFKRNADAISLTQMVEGIKTRDGRQLDRGAGLSRRGVMAGCAGLVEKRIITVEKRLSPHGDNEINVYSLRFRLGVGQQMPYGGELAAPGVGNQMPPQKTGGHTGEQNVEDSKGTPASIEKYSADRDVLANYITDFSHEFADRAPLASSISRAQNLYQRSGLSLDQFVDILYAARSITKERSASVREVPDESGRKSRMHYYFAIVEDLLEQKLPATGTGND